MNKADQPVKVFISKTDFLEKDVLIERLLDLGYRHVEMVFEPGDMASRGSILDVFSPNQSHPIRLDFFSDNLDRINSFDVGSQKSLSALDSCHFESAKDLKRSLKSDEALEPDLSLLSEIKEGSFVVHENHGVAIYKGLVRMTISNVEGEYLHLSYKGADKLYVPISQIGRLYMFSRGDQKPQLNALHDGSWSRSSSKAKRDLKDLVEDIYYLQKQRQAEKGFCFSEDTEAQLSMETLFEHPLTADQQLAIEDVKRDMCQSKPMDRVLCGDVGFGKTEVLIRAAFKAIQDAKQVVVLVPTTILAEQHLKTFKKRFADFPITMASLSRFKNKAEKADIVKKLASKGLDLVIGTHRLLQPDIKFSDLGLIIVDEEQRFGVRHKERLKQLKASVAVLSISATPLPRTLYMALTGSREFSHIHTPPKGRKPIHTSVSLFDLNESKEAIEYELDRGGQVFYLYNHIAGLDRKAAQLKKVMPKLRIGIAYSTMRPKELEEVMQDFYHKKFDVLLCTTIIENGLDIPNVNTIVIERAEYLGLSQIHQIRGRVGRSTRDSYAHIYYSKEALSEKSKKRLDALKEYVALGSGYQLALKDLEIRGAGSLLGEKQHGHMSNIGFDLYCKLLKETLQRKKGERPEQNNLLDVLGIQLYIPADYMESSKQRFRFYQRINAAKYLEDIEDLEDELNDRFGAMPSFVEAVFNSVKNAILAYR